MAREPVRRLKVYPGGRVRRARAVPTRPVPDRPVSNAQIAIVMLLVAETMFFAGLIGAYLVFRVGSVRWPPADLPRLPLGVTSANTVVLLASAATAAAALRALRAGDLIGLERRLGWTLLLGATFLAVQGSEWVRLIGRGLTLGTGTYGATFYTLIGAHALHVLAAVVWVGAIWIGAWRRRFRPGRATAVELGGVYWFFVCALWLVLFCLVYVL